MVYRNVLSALFIFLFAGCASLPLQKARTAFYEGDLTKADRELEDCGDVSAKDRLLCYMEKGTVLHYSQDYKRSTDALLEASRLMEAQDQISVSDQTTAVLINDRTTTYKGEYSERLWVHTLLMMNFLLQYRYESALVEGKQALEVYDRYPGSLEDDCYTRALIALCFENMDMPDDARIEYEKLADAMGGESIIPTPISPGRGELVLFIGQGRIPGKIAVDVVYPPSIRISIPRYTDAQPVSPLSVICDDRPHSALRISADLGQVAEKSLNDRSAALLARQALRAGVKEAVAQEIGEKNQLGEAVTRILLFLLEEADTRSWQTLPGHMTLLRIELEAGIHEVEIASGYTGTLRLGTVDIPEGRRVYRSVRF